MKIRPWGRSQECRGRCGGWAGGTGRERGVGGGCERGVCGGRGAGALLSPPPCPAWTRPPRPPPPPARCPPPQLAAGRAPWRVKAAVLASPAPRPALSSPAPPRRGGGCRGRPPLSTAAAPCPYDALWGLYVHLRGPRAPSSLSADALPSAGPTRPRGDPSNVPVSPGTASLPLLVAHRKFPALALREMSPAVLPLGRLLPGTPSTGLLSPSASGAQVGGRGRAGDGRIRRAPSAWGPRPTTPGAPSGPASAARLTDAAPAFTTTTVTRRPRALRRSKASLRRRRRRPGHSTLDPHPDLDPPVPRGLHPLRPQTPTPSTCLPRTPGPHPLVPLPRGPGS